MRFLNSAALAASALFRGTDRLSQSAALLPSAALETAELLGKGVSVLGVTIGVGSAMFAIACGAVLLLRWWRKRGETEEWSEMEIQERVAECHPVTMNAEIAEGMFPGSNGSLWVDAPAAPLWE
jgi:hypothetical protein